MEVSRTRAHWREHRRALENIHAFYQTVVDVDKALGPREDDELEHFEKLREDRVVF